MDTIQTALTLPLMIDFRSWALQIQLDLNQFNIPNPPRDEKNWQSWAASLIAANEEFYTMPYPSRNVYKNPQDWKKWAEFFVEIIYTI